LPQCYNDISGALIAVCATRIIWAWRLALCCIGLAGFYYFLNSPFLALMEILIYGGGLRDDCLR
jgi:NADH-quinone oxidoreductase subunit J